MLILVQYQRSIHDNIKKWTHRNKDIETDLLCSHGNLTKEFHIFVNPHDVEKLRRIFHYLRHLKIYTPSTQIYGLREMDPFQIYNKLPLSKARYVHDIVDKSRKQRGELE